MHKNDCLTSFTYVAVRNNFPVACADTIESIQSILEGQTGVKFLGYVAFPASNKSDECFEGSLYFKSEKEDMTEFKVFLVPSAFGKTNSKDCNLTSSIKHHENEQNDQKDY